jgi:3-hydroxyisobutyrate dehydrogenase
VKAGFRPQVFDARAAEAARFAAEVGGEVASSPRSLGENSDVVITMLPTSEIVSSVLLDGDGIAAGLRPGSIVIDTSSGVPTETATISQRLAESDIQLIDAPVSGGVKKAISGELAIMIGGDKQIAEQVSPILQAMGKSIT